MSQWIIAQFASNYFASGRLFILELLLTSPSDLPLFHSRFQCSTCHPPPPFFSPADLFLKIIFTLVVAAPAIELTRILRLSMRKSFHLSRRWSYLCRVQTRNSVAIRTMIISLLPSKQPGCFEVLWTHRSATELLVWSLFWVGIRVVFPGMLKVASGNFVLSVKVGSSLAGILVCVRK